MILIISWPNLPGRKMLNRADRAVMAGRGCAFMSKAYILNCVGSMNDEKWYGQQDQGRQHADGPDCDEDLEAEG